MKIEKEYCKEKTLEMFAFHNDMEARKKLAEQMIMERGEEIRAELTKKTNRAIEDDLKKQEERMKMAEQIENASVDGDYELVNQLLKKMNEL